MKYFTILFLLLSVAASGADAPAVQLAGEFCIKCHNAQKSKGGVRLDRLSDETEVMKSRALLDNAWKRVLNREMPPDDAPQPTAEQREALVAWLEKTIERVDLATPPQPGRVTMRRLNRREYRNTVRDLLGVKLDPEFDPTRDFPEDGGNGFDTVGDTLTLSPLHMERYLSAAEQLFERMVIVGGLDGPKTWRFGAKDIRKTSSKDFAGIEGQVPCAWTVDLPVKQTGTYSATVVLHSDSTNKLQAQMALKGATKKDKEKFTYTRDAKPQKIERKLLVNKESGVFTVYYQYEQNKPQFEAADAANGAIFVDSIEIKGPLDISADKLPEGHRRIFIARPGPDKTRDAAAREVLANFLKHAFRRPVTEIELAKYVKLFELADAPGESFEQAMLTPLTAALASPQFLFRVERDPEPVANTYALTDYELANRLSYFLWSSMPDAELFEVAKKGSLREPAELERQARRMLADSRADALSESFTTQWLQLEKLDTLEPDKKSFGEFGTGLRRAMQQEAVLLFRELLTTGGSLLQLLDTNHSYLSEQLAKHYNIPALPREKNALHGDTLMKRYDLPDKKRGGVLTMAAVLAVTSNPDRTSPVKRGKWVLEAMLGQVPPPPPPMVEPLKEKPGDSDKLTLRQRMERHREDATCAGCHKRMDPLGFAFENYDLVGRWRDKDGKVAVDASGVLPDGRAFNGAGELKKILLAQKDDFIRNLTGKMMTYALGRPVEPYDRQTINAIAANVTRVDYRGDALVFEIVKSMPFRQRSIAPQVPAEKNKRVVEEHK